MKERDPLLPSSILLSKRISPLSSTFPSALSISLPPFPPLPTHLDFHSVQRKCGVSPFLLPPSSHLPLRVPVELRDTFKLPLCAVLPREGGALPPPNETEESPKGIFKTRSKEKKRKKEGNRKGQKKYPSTTSRNLPHFPLSPPSIPIPLLFFP
eukprot:Sspe_Gene.39203::Locus_18914_Transcript_1_1_Confidence_1.000_Length_1272::g.39203::m.39203